MNGTEAKKAAAQAHGGNWFEYLLLRGPVPSMHFPGKTYFLLQAPGKRDDNGILRAGKFVDVLL